MQGRFIVPCDGHHGCLSHEVGHPDHHDGSKATALPMSHEKQYSSVLTLSPEAFTLAFVRCWATTT